MSAISIHYSQLISQNGMLEGQYLTLVSKAETLKAANEDLRRSLEQLRNFGLQGGLEGLRSAAQALGPGPYGWTVNQALSEVKIASQDEVCEFEALSIRLYAVLQELAQRLTICPGKSEKRALFPAWETASGNRPVDTPLCRLFLQPADTASGSTAGNLVAGANVSLRGKVCTLLSSLGQTMNTLQTEGSKRTVPQYMELPRTEASALHTDSTEDLSESYRRVSPPRPSPRARVLPSHRRFASAPRALFPQPTADESELREVHLLRSFRVSLKQHRPSLSVCQLRPSQPSKSTTDIRALQKGLAKVRKLELEASRPLKSASKEVNFPFLRPFGRV